MVLLSIIYKIKAGVVPTYFGFSRKSFPQARHVSGFSTAILNTGFFNYRGIKDAVPFMRAILY
jgi:hypothetical protein